MEQTKVLGNPMRKGNNLCDCLSSFCQYFDKATIKNEVVEDVWGDSGGEIKGDPQIDKGKVEDALLFDGDIDYVLVDSESINKDYSAITLECWAFINALDDSWNRIISLDDMPTNENVVTLYYDDDDNQHGFFVRASGKSTDANKDLIQEDIPIGEWLHLVGTWDGKTVKYYVPLFRPINVGFDTMYDNLKPTLALNGSHTKGGSHTSRDLYSPNGAFIPIFPISRRGRTQQKVDLSRWGKGMKGTLVHH